jgi:hypothetical protein
MLIPVNFNAVNALPRWDGDVTRYIVPPAPAGRRLRGRPVTLPPIVAMRWPNPMQEVLIFVNGMQNPKDAHRIAALALAGITQREVYGIFNMPGTYVNCYQGLTPGYIWDELIVFLEQTSFGMLDWAKGVIIPILRDRSRGATSKTDIIQSTADWLYPIITSPFVQIVSAAGQVVENVLDFLGAPTTGPSPIEAVRALREELINFVLTLNAGTTNLATSSLFNFLRCPRVQGRLHVRLICHSQGTIIGSNAVDAWSWAKGSLFPPAAPPIATTIYALAGATPFWPNGVSLKFFTASEDMVPWLSLGASYDANALAFLNGDKRFESVTHTVEASGMGFNWFASHNIDEYFTSGFANAIRADLGLPALNQAALDAIELSLQNQFDALGISV